MSDRVHALAFNALTEALRQPGVFVRLSAREAIAAAVVTAVRDELATELRATCDASPSFSIVAAIIGPCVLRRDHDGPVHQAADGVQWTGGDR